MPEVQIKAALNGQKIDKIIFHGPGKSENYTAINGVSDISDDGRFIAYINKTVMDRETGLEWVAGPDKNTSWNEAKRWVENLNVAGGGWRMPTITELKTLYKQGSGSRNMTLLLKTTCWRVWSGETKGSSSACFFNFYEGNKCWFGRDYSFDERGFAVRHQ